MEWRKDGGLQFGPPFLLLLYGAHGRWYNPDTALWLSPDEKGEYTYGRGTSGQDAVNVALVAQQKAHCAQQAGPTDCERFVDDVRTIISRAHARGLNSDVSVMLLAEYYTGISAHWAVGPFQWTWLGGSFVPGLSPQNPPFPIKMPDRYIEPTGVHELNSQMGEALRRKYGFKRIFFTNTHHYFADFYADWFWGSAIGNLANDIHEWDETNRQGQPYSEGEADIAVSRVAARHVATIRGRALQSLLSGQSELSILPDLLAQDACGKSDQEIYADWPPPDIEKILGPAK